MAKRLRETIYKYALASAISVFTLFPLNASAEVLESKIMNSGKEYSMTIDSEKKEYIINPDAEEAIAREMLASCMLDKLATNTNEESKSLDKKTEQFLLENPSEMQLGFSEFSFSNPHLAVLGKNVLEFNPYNIPEMDFNIWKKGNEISLKFNLPSQDFALDWYKNCGITALYSKDAKIIGRGPDKVYVVGQEEGRLGMRNIEKDNFSGEREAYGMLADAILEKGMQQGEKNPLGVVFSSLMKIEDMLAEDEKTKRERVVEYLKSKYKCLPYSPAYFYATPEQGRSVPVKFDKNPEELYFFINSNIVLTKEEQGSQSKEEGALLKLLKVDTGKVTDETPAGKIIKHSRLLSNRIDDFLKEYEHKKQGLDFEGKTGIYENLSVWDAQIEPFINMLSKLQDKEIRGNIENLPEFQEFKRDAQKKTEQIIPLRHIVNEYRFISRYSKNDGDKILELIKREERALKENNLEMYLSCLTDDAAKKNKERAEEYFEWHKQANLDEDYQVGNILAKGNHAIASITYNVKDNRNYRAEIKYDGLFIKEEGEWKNDIREIRIAPRIIKENF